MQFWGEEILIILSLNFHYKTTFNVILPLYNSCIPYVQITPAVPPSSLGNLKVNCPSQSSINVERVHHIDPPSQI